MFKKAKEELQKKITELECRVKELEEEKNNPIIGCILVRDEGYLFWVDMSQKDILENHDNFYKIKNWDGEKWYKNFETILFYQNIDVNILKRNKIKDKIIEEIKIKENHGNS